MNPFSISQQTPAQADLDVLLDICFGPGRLARTAERLRENNQPITAYGHCATGDSGLLGAVSFWPIKIGDAAALLLGPLAVHPDMQGRGLGMALMQAALQTIDETRFAIVLLVGDLPYYERAGFTIAPTQIVMPGPVDPQRLLVRGAGDLCAALAGSVRPAPELC
jgi:predicted N-acetyltransferase YhbS